VGMEQPLGPLVMAFGCVFWAWWYQVWVSVRRGM
jgi:hypothetical protein